VNATDYLSRLRRKNEERNSPSPNCINLVKGFTQFLQFIPDAKGAYPIGTVSSEKVNNTKVTALGWLIHYPGRDPVETVFAPAGTHAELLEWNRDAVAAEPLGLATASLPPETEAGMRQWLALVGEVDPHAIDRFPALSDAETHRWVLEQLTRM
jgi:hypothetical protein